MRQIGSLLILLIVISCGKRSEYLIEVPTESHITSEEILTVLEKQVTLDPKNERLIYQQLYFCEQLGWPARCERVLVRAKSKWGLTEKLIDQSIAYYQKFGDHEQVAALLNGAFETRSRLETKIQIASDQNAGDFTFLNRYLGQYNDSKAFSLSADIYLRRKDTINAMLQFDNLFESAPDHSSLIKYYPILERELNFNKSIQIIENQLNKRKKNDNLVIDLASNYYQIDSLNYAKKLLKDLNTKEAKKLLISWFRERQEWDSALLYTNEMLMVSPQNRELVLTKANILESKGWITPSLPYYEHAFKLDSTDIELANHLQIVRRKVAYLRQKREQESRIVPPSLERKTSN